MMGGKADRGQGGSGKPRKNKEKLEAYFAAKNWATVLVAGIRPMSKAEGRTESSKRFSICPKKKLMCSECSQGHFVMAVITT